MDYTEGEWKAKGKQIICLAEQGDVIAVAYEQAMMPKGMAEANANLIASAPTQNEALIWVAEWLGIRKPDGEKPNRADVIRIVNEALAKAKPE